MKKIFLILFMVNLGNPFFCAVHAAGTDLAGKRSEVIDAEIKGIKNEKKKTILMVSLAEAYVAESLPDKAVSVCAEALNREPDKKSAQKVFRIMGEIYFSKKEYFKSIEAFQEAIAVSPKHIGTRLALAEAYEKNDLFELALQEYAKILELNGKSFEANLRTGDIYFQNGFYDKALKYYRRAVLTKMDEKAYRNLAVCYETLGDVNLAIAMIRSSIAVLPTYDGYTYGAKLYLLKSKFNDAENLLLKAIDLDPARTDAYFYLGLLYLEKKDFTVASEYFLQICKKDKDCALAHFFLGEIYNKQSLFSAAKSELKAAKELSKTPMLKEYSGKFLDFLEGKQK